MYKCDKKVRSKVNCI